MLQSWAVPIIDETRALAQQSGDLRTRVAIESNAALAHLDAGEIDHAEVLMARSDRILGRASLDLGRFNQTNNRAELALARGDFQQAAKTYSKAAAMFGAWTPAYAQDLVSAGLGLCALETGDLSEARRREQELGPDPEVWSFDPTTILTFRAKLLERRGLREQAIDFLLAQSDRLRDRHVLAWMKVVELAAKLMVKDKRWSEAVHLAEEGQSVAFSLELTLKEGDFRRLIESCGRQ
jgi:tetratricopeptide (TPR) repeat protein